MRPLRPSRVVLGFGLAAGLCISVVGPTAGQSPAQPFAGTNLTLWEFQTPIGDTHDKHLQEFEAATGIHVDHLMLTEGAYVDKVKLAQLAKDTAPDVYYTDFAFKGDVVDRGAEEYLDPYLADPAKTPADYNAADISPGLMGLCQIDGKQILSAVLLERHLLLLQQEDPGGRRLHRTTEDDRRDGRDRQGHERPWPRASPGSACAVRPKRRTSTPRT